MLGILVKLNLLLWIYAILVLIQDFKWHYFLAFMTYMTVYYAILYWCYRHDRKFELYLIGFGLAFLILPQIFIAMRMRDMPVQQYEWQLPQSK